jgi:3-hydroxyisobutyrate dehydrogenase-like beta-hydroxyacid dehydrogenase
MAQFGFIGAGMMGHGMAVNLLKAGHAVAVIANRNRAPIEDLVSRGATEVTTLEHVATGKDAVFLCLNGTPQVEEIIAKLESHLSAGQTVVDTGTSIPDSTIALAKRLAAKNIAFIDAPVTGGPQQAESGELIFMVGATDADFQRVEPWLTAMAKKVLRMGMSGAGAHAKLCNNFISVGQTALVIEAYKLARSKGVDWSKLYDINKGGIAFSGSLERVVPAAIAGDFDAYKFSLANCAKDFGYITDVLAATGTDATLPDALRRYFEAGGEAIGRDALLSHLLKP